MLIKIEESWKNVLENEFKKEYFIKLINFIKNEYRTKEIFPAKDKIFEAFNLCPFDKTKIIIIGQDPYHEKGQSHGLCFSVNKNIKIPPSLVNIYKELKSDIKKEIPKHGNLEHWAKQGVLMLNATLTVIEHKAGSHQKKGWEEFTDAVIKILSDKKENLVFLLWGSYAQSKNILIDESKHLVLKTVHPSPLSAFRGFFESKHFSKSNQFLKEKGLNEINW